MKVSELITQLRELEEVHGDVEVEIQYTVRETVYGESYCDREEESIDSVTFEKKVILLQS